MVTSSWSWPNIFDVARSKVNLYNDTKSITNRVKLLLLTEPTELYMNPRFGVGLKKFLFRYNSDNVVALIQDQLIEQLRLWEPGVIAEETTVVRNNPRTSEDSLGISVPEKMDTLDLTVTLVTSRMKTVSFTITDEDIQGES